MKLISPKFSNGFSRKPSKNWLHWLNSEYENGYMQQYPRAATFIYIAMWIVFLLPSVLFVYSLIVLTRNGVEIFGPLAGLGLIGGLSFGFGLANIVSAFMHIYLGHFITLVSMVIGIFLLLAVYSLIYLFA